MHETTVDNGVIFQNYLVAVAAFQSYLIQITSMRTVLHLLEVPYNTELAHGGDQVALLFTVFSNLSNFRKKIPRINNIALHALREIFFANSICIMKWVGWEQAKCSLCDARSLKSKRTSSTTYSLNDNIYENQLCVCLIGKCTNNFQKNNGLNNYTLSSVHQRS